MVLLLQYNYYNFYKHDHKNYLNKATEEKNTSILIIWLGGELEPHIVVVGFYDTF